MTTFAIAFAAYTLLIVAAGAYAARFQRKGNEDYFLAGRGLGPWVAALSASASSESGWVTIGLVGFAYTSGMQAMWIVPGCLLGYVFNWFFLARPMRERAAELGAITVPDFLALHFGERKPILRIMTVVVIMLAMWMYVAAQFAAAGKAFESAFPGIDYGWGVVLGASIVLLYTVAGGFRATCWTDSLQAILMLVALGLFPIFMLREVGGLDFVREHAGGLSDGNFLSVWPSVSGYALFGFVIGSGALGINLGFLGQPHVLVRFMALRNARDARICGIISIVWGALVLAGAAGVGVIMRAAVEGGLEWTAATSADGETGLVVAAAELLPGVLAGVILAAVLAAMCSTADSQLIVTASAGGHDIGHRLCGLPDEGRRTTWINRVIVLALGIAAVLLVIDEEVTVYQFVLTYAWAVLGAAIGPQVALAVLWRRATYAGCIAGMATGLTVALAWKEIQDGIEATNEEWVSIYNLSLAFACALVVNVVVSLLTRRGD